MNREKNIEKLKEHKEHWERLLKDHICEKIEGIETIDAFEAAIKALEQEPCDDAISRILKRMWNCRGKHTTSIDKVKMEQIIRDELPPVTQKSGKWIPHSSGIWIEYYECSECGRGHSIHSDFCPNCGADMRGAE